MNWPLWAPLLIGLVLAGWLIAALVAILRGMAMQKSAAKSQRQLRRVARLLEEAPAIPLIVRVDGRLEGPDRLARLLGLTAMPAYLSELTGRDTGLAADDHAELASHVGRVQKTGQAFEMSVGLAGSERSVRIRGMLADTATAGASAALLWFFDMSEADRRIAELDARAQQARAAFVALSGLIEAAPMPMWHRDNDLRLSLVNRAYVDAVEAESAESVVEEGIELIEPVDGRMPMAVAADAKQSGRIIERTVPVTIRGRRRMLRVVDLPIGEAGIAGYAIDIQDLQDARAEIRQFRDAQRDMLDSLSAAVAQFDVSRELIFCNQAFQRLFSLRADWLTESAEFDRVLDRMREAGRVPEVRDFGEWRQERRAWFQAEQTIEESWHLSDGTHLRALAHPMPEGGLLLIFEDRTEQVQLASARDTLLRVRTATFNNLSEALAVFTADGKLNLWNSRFAAQWSLAEEELGAHPHADALFRSIAGQLADEAAIGPLREAVRLATLERRDGRGSLSGADGRHFDFATTPLPDGNALLTILDVSDSRKIEQALRERNTALLEADAIRNRFLANMSYEFRTPLTSIAGFAEMLAEGLAGELPEQAGEYLDAILQSVERLSAQIGNVLDLSQGEAGALPLNIEEVNVPALLRELVDERQAQADRQGIDLALSIDGRPGKLPGDRQRLHQALDQLVDNALKFTPSGGRILVHADRANKRVRIVVSDNGPGMDADELERVRAAIAGKLADGAQHRDSVGLALARNLVEAHKGSLEILSEKGQGTMVMVELPG